MKKEPSCICSIPWTGSDTSCEACRRAGQGLAAGHRRKTGPQLDAEIADALKHPPRSKRVAVVWADLNVLAQAASFGDVSVSDLAPESRTTATISKTWRKQLHAAKDRLHGLITRGLLAVSGASLGDKYKVTAAGRQALVDAGYAPSDGGFWLKPGGRRPSWM